MHEQHLNWLVSLGMPEHLNAVVMTVLVCGALIVCGFLVRLKVLTAMKSADGGLVPDSKINLASVFDFMSEGLFGLTRSVMGDEDAKHFFPIVGTIFCFVFFSNLVGLIPGVMPSTENLNTTMALGLFTFLYYNYAGVKRNGLGYFKHFLGPVMWLAPLMLIIEIASHLFRPLSLALRLRGNINGDHVILGVFSGLVPYGVPVIFLGLGIFVAFVQAFVFSLMTMVYISLSVAHDEH